MKVIIIIIHTIVVKGIGGFWVRFRSNRKAEDDEDIPGIEKSPMQSMDKPKRKPIRRKTKSKLVESFPTYLQEAFFGRELLDTPKEKELHSSSDDELVSKFQVRKNSIWRFSFI